MTSTAKPASRKRSPIREAISAVPSRFDPWVTRTFTLAGRCKDAASATMSGARSASVAAAAARRDCAFAAPFARAKQLLRGPVATRASNQIEGGGTGGRSGRARRPIARVSVPCRWPPVSARPTMQLNCAARCRAERGCAQRRVQQRVGPRPTLHCSPVAPHPPARRVRTPLPARRHMPRPARRSEARWAR